MHATAVAKVAPRGTPRPVLSGSWAWKIVFSVFLLSLWLFAVLSCMYRTSINVERRSFPDQQPRHPWELAGDADILRPPPDLLEKLPG